jgi:hypothetical protein
MVGIVVQNLVEEPFEGAVVHDGQDAEGPIIQFIGCDIPGEISQNPVQIRGDDSPLGFFPPWPPPSSGWLPRERKPDGLATSAKMPPDRVYRLPPPIVRPGEPRDGYNGCRGRPIRQGRH